MSSTPIKGKRPIETENNTSPDKRKMKQAKTQAGAAASGTAKAAGKAPGAGAATAGAAAGKPPAAKKQAGGKPKPAAEGKQGKQPAAKKPAPKSATATAAAEEDIGSADSGDDDDADAALAGIADPEALKELDAVQERLRAIDGKFAYEKALLTRRFNLEKAADFAARGKVIRERVPGFWTEVLLQHEGLRGLFQDFDAEALSALLDVAVVELKEPEVGYTIVFTFDAARNPLFSNAKLEKTYRHVKLTAAEKQAQYKKLLDEADGDKEAVAAVGDYAIKVTASEVKFKAADADEKYMTSFFMQWFDAEAAAEDNAEDTIAEIIRSDIWPDPLGHYLDAMDDNGPSGDDDDDELDLDGDEGDDGDDDGADA